MICYNSMAEAWIDDEDDSFYVDMTPEGGEPDFEFETQEEFWNWYNSSD